MNVPDLSKWKGRFPVLLGKDWKLKVLVAAGIAGMLLILISGMFGDKEAVADDQVDTGTAVFTSEEYAASLETKLTDLITGIDGVGQAKVMVTLESGVKYVYVQEEKRTVDRTQELGEAQAVNRVVSKENLEQSYILVENKDGRKEALVQTALQPKVQGVVIACEGGGDIRVEQSLINVVTTALNISSNRVCVVKISY